MKKISITISCIIFLSVINLFAQEISETAFIEIIDSSLAELVNIQNKIKDIHPCLNESHPIAVAYKDSLLIFDFDGVAGYYKFAKKTPQPFPIPEGLQASFPLSVYNNIPSCVITHKTLNSTTGYATMLHEFIHCCQFNSVEQELKQNLKIYSDASEKQDYSWELMHPFPYNDSIFVNYYDNFKHALQLNQIDIAKQYRLQIKNFLSQVDYEYLLWEEWKEGLARFVENKIRVQLGLMENDSGKEKPYDRVVFYYIGSLLITKISEMDRNLSGDIGKLFKAMENFRADR
jgi:hypothetical protein